MPVFTTDSSSASLSKAASNARDGAKTNSVGPKLYTPGNSARSAHSGFSSMLVNHSSDENRSVVGRRAGTRLDATASAGVAPSSAMSADREVDEVA